MDGHGLRFAATSTIDAFALTAVRLFYNQICSCPNDTFNPKDALVLTMQLTTLQIFFGTNTAAYSGISSAKVSAGL